MARPQRKNAGIRYSEAFKMQVVREVEQEGLACDHVRRKYGIGGTATVPSWVRKYGKGSWGKRIRVETPEEINHTEQLKRRVRLLEQALAEVNVDLALERQYTRLACRRAGIEDVEGFKKKSGWEAAHRAVERDGELLGVTVSSLCRRLGMSRQNYYARRRRRQRRQVDQELVAGLVRRERQLQPRLGARKVHHRIQSELAQAGVRIGRDRLFEVLRAKDLLLAPMPAQYPHTTQSYHNLPLFRNQVQETVLDRPNQVWVSDLTYLRTLEGYLYLALITDKFSRKIVGYHVGDTLEAVGCVRALERALLDLPAEARPIHHSDQGSQYCCHQYVNRLQERGLGISMTESHHCAENALAERRNGILKQEYGLGLEFGIKADARRAVDQGVWLYNTQRPHTALDYQTPAQVHQAGLN